MPSYGLLLMVLATKVSCCLLPSLQLDVAQGEASTLRAGLRRAHAEVAEFSARANKLQVGWRGCMLQIWLGYATCC